MYMYIRIWSPLKINRNSSHARQPLSRVNLTGFTAQTSILTRKYLSWKETVHTDANFLKIWLCPNFSYCPKNLNCSNLPPPIRIWLVVWQGLGNSPYTGPEFLLLCMSTSSVHSKVLHHKNIPEKLDGLRMMDVDSMIKALRLAWIWRLLRGGHQNWKSVPYYFFDKYGGLQ